MDMHTHGMAYECHLMSDAIRMTTPAEPSHWCGKMIISDSDAMHGDIRVKDKFRLDLNRQFLFGCAEGFMMDSYSQSQHAHASVLHGCSLTS